MTITPPLGSELVLENGIRVLVRENHSSSAISLRGIVEAGSIFEPREKAGTAEFVARLLTRGTKRRSKLQVAEAIDTLGAALSFFNSQETGWFAARCTSETLPALVEILVDCLANPSFPNEEVEKARGEIVTQLKKEEDDTRTRARKELLALIYEADEAFGRDPLGTLETVQTISRANVVDFYEAHYSPESTIITASGDTTLASLSDELKRHLGRWEGTGGRKQAFAVSGVSSEGRVKRVSMQHKSQVDITYGCRTLPRRHPRYYALNMANLILGVVGLMGRLGRHLRDEQGLAYYSLSALDARRYLGHWVAIAGVNPNNVDRALEGIRREVEAIRAEPVPADELEFARSNQIGALPLRLEMNEKAADLLLEVAYHHLGLDYLDRYRRIVGAISESEIRDAAREFLDPVKCSTVLAGPV